MHYRITTIALAFAGTLLATQASAQAANQARGAYVSLQAGLARASDVDLGYFDQAGTFGGTGAQDSLDFRADFKGAFAIGGAIGYDFGPVRADVEVNYARHNVDSLAVVAFNGQPVTLTAADRAEVCAYLEADSCGGSGNSFTVDGVRLRKLTALANAWVDIPVGSVVTPYVGGGLGIAGFELNGEGKAGFAWQLGAGIAADISPNVVISFDFRRRQVNGTTIVDEDFPGEGVRVGRLRSNLFMAGLRFRF